MQVCRQQKLCTIALSSSSSCSLLVEYYVVFLFYSYTLCLKNVSLVLVLSHIDMVELPKKKDDSWHVLATNAMESYGIFHSITFIESNRTQNFQPRELRFTPGSKDLELLKSGIFGPNTTVHLENFVYEHKERPMVRG